MPEIDAPLLGAVMMMAGAAYGVSVSFPLAWSLSTPRWQRIAAVFVLCLSTFVGTIATLAMVALVVS